MIRVNLLPRKVQAKREGSKAWVVVLVAAAILEIVGIAIVHGGKKRELDAQLDENRQLEADIADKKSKVANHENVKRQLAEFQAREDAIAKLQAGRTGPTAVLLELSRILTPGKLPTMDKELVDKLKVENPGMLPNEKWDPHRLWLGSFKELDRTIEIGGVGSSNGDVAEFLRRMTVSRFFTDVMLVKTEEQASQKVMAVGTQYTTISFMIKGKVRY
jgi:type IV pilus assembly protein PilN